VDHVVSGGLPRPYELTQQNPIKADRIEGLLKAKNRLLKCSYLGAMDTGSCLFTRRRVKLTPFIPSQHAKKYAEQIAVTLSRSGGCRFREEGVQGWAYVEDDHWRSLELAGVSGCAEVIKCGKVHGKRTGHGIGIAADNFLASCKTRPDGRSNVCSPPLFSTPRLSISLPAPLPLPDVSIP
jgi:hypothetical protein